MARGMFIAAAILGWCSATGLARADGEISYNRDIRQILSNNCFKCHGPDARARKGRPQLDTFETATASWRNKRPIVPGDADASELIRRVSSDDPKFRMPPEEEGKTLTPEEIAALRQWIAEGAKYEKHWAYIAPEQPPLPGVRDERWPQNAIDYFILARLEAEGLTPSPEADRFTLVRRLYLDLTGLPPLPDDVKRWTKRWNEETYEALVDSLLASPRYGERWAQMWLDLARYADSRGYEKDDFRTIWPYRDWVIRAFNADMPFDQFTIEQLAGDLLPDSTQDQLVATAFHRNTMNNDEGGTDDEEFRVAAVIDRVNTTYQVWMGTTMQCAQCHAHKYDPIGQTEFYESYAFFNQTADSDKQDEQPTLALGSPESIARWEVVKARYNELKPEVDRIRKELEAEGLPDDERTRLEAEKTKVGDEFSSVKKEKEELDAAIPVIPILRELPVEERRDTRTFPRGSFLSPGDPVAPDTPDTFPAYRDEWPRDRLGFAQWLMAPENPLTARVAVNRHWERLFGTGIVSTPEEFGTQGELPSHPDLLDWLAVEFRETGWSFKQLCKLIVMSSTYRQSSAVRPELLERDANNRLLARGPRLRLDAEAVRDAALAAGGLLSVKMYGPSVKPPQPDGVWNVPYSGAKWETSAGEDARRRGLYTFIRRSAPYPSMVAFDGTSREVCTIRRIRTNTPLQALVTLNDPVYLEAAQSLAREVADEGGRSVKKQAEFAFLLALARPPTGSERERVVDLFKQEAKAFEDDPEAASAMATNPIGPLPDGADAAKLAAWTAVANVLLNLDEFLTRD